MPLLRLVRKCLPIILMLVLFVNPLNVRPAFANNVIFSESQFLSLLFREYAANELVQMPTDGTYRSKKVYHLAKRLGLPVVGTSYTLFGNDPITRKRAAQIIAQGFTGQLYSEQESVEWLFQQNIYLNEKKTYETYAPDDLLTKADALELVSKLKQMGYTNLVKNANGKIGKYRVDSFSVSVATYNTYEQAYQHAKKYHYTKVVDTATGMVLWSPKTNTRILQHLYVNGKWAAGFDTRANAIAYATKLGNYQSRIIDGNRNKSVWDNAHRYIVKSPEGYDVTFRSLDDAITRALETDELRSYIQPLSDEFNQYTNSFLSKASANIGNGVIIYNGYEIDKKKEGRGYYEPGFDGQYPKDFFKPYIAYQKDGKFVDRFFDTIIVLGRLYSETGRFEETPDNQANYQEWNWYKERTLQPNGVVDRLNEDTATIPELDKVKLYVAIPYPKKEGTIIKLDGTSTNADYTNRLELVKWYVEQMVEEFNSGKFSHIQFEGFYWLNETVISKEDEMLVTNVANLIHSNQKRFIFSPHSNATNFKNWKKYGFDAAYFQSNAKNATTDTPEYKRRLHWGYMNAYQYGMGVNLEIEDIAFSAIDSLKKSFDPYMEYGKRYGFQGNSTIMYQGTVMMHRLGTANTKMYREQYLDYYDKIYQFLKGDTNEPVMR